MGRYVQKFGGTSVATIAHIQRAADVVARQKAAGHDVVVAVSAMGETTDELMALAQAIAVRPSRRELDMLLSSGEQVSAALMAMALSERGVEAVSLLGHQVPFLTDSVHARARIREVGSERLEAELAAGRVPVIAGFQADMVRRQRSSKL